MLAALAAPLLGGLLGWAGLHKLRRPADDAALSTLLRDAARTRRALRTVGAVELAVAAALVAGTAAAAYGAAALGVAFLGYLAWARSAAPDASCGCTSARHTRVTGRSFARAGLVAAGGLAAVRADAAWWTVLAGRPVQAVGLLAAGVAGLGLLSAELDSVLLLPVRRTRLRLLGHPHAAPPGGTVPVAASVELLESSVAWHATADVTRSGLLEHWDGAGDAAGWRFLRFAGVADGRPVTVVFAVDAAATVDTAAEPAVRVTVVDDEREEVLAAPQPAGALAVAD